MWNEINGRTANELPRWTAITDIIVIFYWLRYIHNLNHKMCYSECIGLDGWPSVRPQSNTEHIQLCVSRTRNTPCNRKLSCLLLPLCVEHHRRRRQTWRKIDQKFTTLPATIHFGQRIRAADTQQPTGSNSSKAIIKPNTHLPHTYGRVFNVYSEHQQQQKKRCTAKWEH